MTNANSTKALISIVTRTKNRPILLERVIEHLSKQSIKAVCQWVIINDGGNILNPEEIVKKLNKPNWQIEIMNLPQSVGRSNAANEGFQRAIGKYCILHDDDDALALDALEIMVNFLDNNPNNIAVVCDYFEIYEHIKNGYIIENTRKLISLPNEINLINLAARNIYPPIVQMFRTEALETIKGFDPQYNVLEDWIFNIKLALLGKVARINKPLAFYHCRPDTNDENGNSIFVDNQEHLEIAKVLIENEVEKSIQNGNMDLGTLLLFGTLSKEIEKINYTLNRQRKILRSIPIIGKFLSRK